MATQQVVNVGTQANDATGDLLRDAFTKINNNFAVFFTGNFPTAQMTVGPPISGTALSVVALAGQNAISTTIGGVNFATPSSGNTLTVGGFSGSTAIVANAASATDLALFANGNVNLGGSTASSIAITGGLTIGSPTGGNKGSGSLNAASIFVNNVAVLTSLSGAVTSFTSNTGLSTNVAATGAVTVTNTGVLSLAGTANQIAVSASTGAITASLSPNVVIPAPVSGVALAVSGASGVNAFTAANFAVATNGNVVISAPTSGAALTVTANGGTAISLQGVAGADTLLMTGSSSSGNSFGLDILAGTTSGDAALRINNQANTLPMMKINGIGNTSFLAPSSGDTVTTTNVAGGNALVIVGNSAGTAVLRLNTTATTGANSVTLAITNKPGAAAQTTPAKWLPVNLDGTTYYIPAFS